MRINQLTFRRKLLCPLFKLTPWALQKRISTRVPGKLILVERHWQVSSFFKGVNYKLHQGQPEQQLPIWNTDQQRQPACITRVREDSERVQESDEQPQEVRDRRGPGTGRQLGPYGQQTLQEVTSSGQGRHPQDPIFQVRSVGDEFRYWAGDCQVQAGRGPQPCDHSHHHLSPRPPR